MAIASESDVTCPQCGHSNPPNSGYCWECRFDFVPNVRPKDLIPPPYSTTRKELKAASEPGQATAFGFELLASTLIIGSTWAVLSWIYPSMGVIKFAAGWAAALVLAVFSEKHLPPAETDPTKYWSWNPFDYEDDRNRAIRSWHRSLFLPKVVLKTIRRGFAIFGSPR